MKILITGSKGFISSHLIPKLQKKGHTIFTYDKEDNIEKVLGIKFDCIVHLAGITQNQEIKKDREKFLWSSIDLLKKIMIIPTDKFIFPSSGKIYGEGNNLTEDIKPNPLNDLGKVKLALENIISYRKGTNIILRLFNVYGEGQNENFLIPTIIRQAKLGNTILLGDVLSERDYIYIDDVCTAFINTIEKKFTEETHIFNISTGISTSAKTITEIISEFTNKKLQICIEESKLRLGEYNNEYGNNKKAILDLNWKVSYSIKQGLEKMLN